MTPHAAALIAVGAALGAALRFALTLSLGRQSESLIPWATMSVNVVGSVILGIVTGIASDDIWLLAGVGFCGALTTFSAFAAENVGYLNRGRTGMAVINVTLSVALCIAGAALGLSVSANVQP